ncbi:MAG TPA: hypothetical protein VFB81_15725, partial [Myxococcales bacterium]|nr:hypothetical protein [Myxococcales bacterium]
TEATLACNSKDMGCGAPGECCSNSCNGAYMCDCSPPGARCNTANDCCFPSLICPRGYCCLPTGSPCTAHNDCCSRACGGTGYCL